MLARHESQSFDLDRLRSDIRPFRLHWFPRLRSTNDHAAALRRRGALFAPAIVLTGRQTAGRGRGRNTWWSAAGCLTVTFVLPVEENLATHQLPLVAGLAVRNAAAELSGDDAVQLKWPNDLVYGGRKLAGLLCERIHKADLIGVGLNVNLNPQDAPADLRQRLTSLSAITGRPLDMTLVLATMARHLHRTLSRRKQHLPAALLEEYDSHHALIGRRVCVQGPAEDQVLRGRCEGIDQLGRLLVRSGEQLHRIVTGHVEMV